MNIILMGAPGSGKGTQARGLSETFGLVHIASGDIFRHHLERGTELGRAAREYIESGNLVPDAVTVAMMDERLGRPDAAGGVLLDGFPRTVGQAEALEAILRRRGSKLTGAVYLAVPDDVLVDRISGRLVCRQCQAPFHRVHRPFRECPEGRCMGEHLVHRSDDDPDTVRVRLALFHRETAPLAAYYRDAGRLVVVDGDAPPAVVAADLVAAVHALAEQTVGAGAGGGLE